MFLICVTLFLAFNLTVSGILAVKCYRRGILLPRRGVVHYPLAGGRGEGSPIVREIKAILTHHILVTSEQHRNRSISSIIVREHEYSSINSQMCEGDGEGDGSTCLPLSRPPSICDKGGVDLSMTKAVPAVIGRANYRELWKKEGTFHYPVSHA